MNGMNGILVDASMNRREFLLCLSGAGVYTSLAMIGCSKHDPTAPDNDIAVWSSVSSYASGGSGCSGTPNSAGSISVLDADGHYIGDSYSHPEGLALIIGTTIYVHGDFPCNHLGTILRLSVKDPNGDLVSGVTFEPEDAVSWGTLALPDILLDKVGIWRLQVEVEILGNRSETLFELFVGEAVSA